MEPGQRISHYEIIDRLGEGGWNPFDTYPRPSVYGRLGAIAESEGLLRWARAGIP